MHETRKNLTTGISYPTLFGKWHGIFSMPNRTESTGHSKAFICSHGPLGGSQSGPAQGRFEPPTCRSTVEHTNHQTTMTAPSRRIDYTSGPQKGGWSSPYWGEGGGSSAKTAPPHVGHPQGAKERKRQAEGQGAWTACPPGAVRDPWCVTATFRPHMLRKLGCFVGSSYTDNLPQDQGYLCLIHWPWSNKTNQRAHPITEIHHSGIFFWI